MSEKTSANSFMALKESLPKRGRKALQEKTGISLVTIDKVFKGECKDLEIIEKVITAAIKLKEEKESKEKAIIKKIQSAIQ